MCSDVRGVNSLSGHVFPVLRFPDSEHVGVAAGILSLAGVHGEGVRYVFFQKDPRDTMLVGSNALTYFNLDLVPNRSSFGESTNAVTILTHIIFFFERIDTVSGNSLRIMSWKMRPDR